MANILIVEKQIDLFREVHGLPCMSGHSVSRIADVDELSGSGQLVALTLLVVNKTERMSLEKVFRKIARSRTTTMVLVVARHPDMDEMEYALRAGALDYIRRDEALEHFGELLGRLETLDPAEEPSIAEIGGRFSILGGSPQMRTCLKTVLKASKSDVSVLIQGETGTGKELFARAIHGLSGRHRENLIVVDCASLPANLVESMLFGYTKGAFTGADATSEGLVMRAHKGTLFLDEASEIPIELQNKFLRVLQERRFRPVGGRQEVASDFRLVAATNKDLSQMVKEGRFRSDLLYRIQSLKLNLPPLRHRLGDLPQLAAHLLRKSCERNRMAAKGHSETFLQVLMRHDWPGNVRELENVLDSVVAIAHGQGTVHPEHLPAYIRVKAARRGGPGHEVSGGADQLMPSFGLESACHLPSYKQYRNKALESLDQHYFKALYRMTGGDMSQAMGIANLSRARLYEFYKKHNLTKAAFKEQ